jgi:molecular chaperone GrpE
VNPEGAGQGVDEAVGQGAGNEQVEGAGTAGAPAGAEHDASEPYYAEGGPGASAEPGGYEEYDHDPQPGATSAEAAEAAEGADLAEEDRLAASLMVDLQRLQAEYVNYKKRVDRDRDVIRTHAVNNVVEALLPVLDDIHMARQAGDLKEGPFAAIADKLEGVLARFGIERVGEVGEEFDPNIHEALMHVQAELPEGATTTTVVQVLQPGYRNGDRLVRAARVSVADPE